MMGGGGFPIDLILFGMIAVFLVLRLRSILGKRTGYERPPQPYQPPQTPTIGQQATAPGMTPNPPVPNGSVIEGRAESVPAPAASGARPLPEPASPAGQTF